MKFEQIRNATIALEYADKKFLVDPWLAPQGSNGTFKELGMEKEVICPEHNELAMPISEKLHQRNIADKILIPADGEIYHF